MEHLSGPIRRKIVGEINQAASVYLFLDYDGTLCRIEPKPEMVRLSASTRRTLKALAKNPRFYLGIISGRSLEQIKSLIGIKDIVYAGNHGLQLRGPGFYYVHAQTQRFAPILREAAAALRTLTYLFPGSFIEDKGVTFTFHYRIMDQKRVPQLQFEFLKRVAPWLNADLVKIVEGKKAFEVRPGVNWDKGSAVRWILLHESPESLPVYIGDDKTDEAAFAALAERGITIRVGSDGDSSAQYFLKDTDEVENLLSSIAGSDGSPPEQTVKSEFE